MRVVALVSGGKDSCFSMHKCKQHGHEIVALANLCPFEHQPDDLDSYCFQTVGHDFIASFATCTGLPLFRLRFRGLSGCRDLHYQRTEGDEVEDLFRLLSFVKHRLPDVQAVSSGAIASDYQRTRVENVCSRLGLTSLAYLWHQPQAKLLAAMVSAGIEAIVVKVACLGLEPRKHLGLTLRQLLPVMLALEQRFGCNVCGEGGEYETITLDCPAFENAAIELQAWQAEASSESSISPVAYLRPTAFSLRPKRAAPLPPPVVEYVPDAFDALAALREGPAPLSSALPAPLPPTVAETGSGRFRCLTVRDEASEATSLTSDRTPKAVHTCLAALTHRLAALGCSWQHVVFVHLYLADMAHFQSANAAYCAVVPQTSAPARACVQLQLPPGCACQADALLARDASGATRAVLHVQSLSEWAPASIGPYSQATVSGGLLRIAGQIPLDPATMQLPSPSEVAAAAQVERCLRHCEAVAQAMKCEFRSCVLALTVYRTPDTPPAACRDGVERFWAAADRRQDAAASVHDIYLQTEGLPTSPVPNLCLVACVPRLPRDSMVEVEAVCVVPGGTALPASSDSGDDSDDDGAGGDQSAMRRSTARHADWAHRLQTHMGRSPTVDGAADRGYDTRCVVAPTRLLMLQVLGRRAERSGGPSGEQKHRGVTSSAADDGLRRKDLESNGDGEAVRGATSRGGAGGGQRQIDDGILDVEAGACGDADWRRVLADVDAAARAGRMALEALCEVRVLYVVGAVQEEDCRREFGGWASVQSVMAAPVFVPVLELHDGANALNWACVLTWVA